jgi:L-2-hydroxyglutarate oxidase LhgO
MAELADVIIIGAGIMGSARRITLLGESTGG